MNLLTKEIRIVVKTKKISVDLERSFCGAAQFLMIIPMMVAPYVIYLPFAMLFDF